MSIFEVNRMEKQKCLFLPRSTLSKVDLQPVNQPLGTVTYILPNNLDKCLQNYGVLVVGLYKFVY